MFNVIKGQYVNQSSCPVMIRNGVKEEKKVEDNSKLEMEKKKEELEFLDKEIEEKKQEIENIEKTIIEKKKESDEKIERLLSEAQEKAEYEIKVSQNEGYQKGYQDGIVKGQEEVILESKNLIIRAQAIIEDVIEMKIKSIKDNESEIIELALDVAKVIIKKEVFCDMEVVERNIKEALRKVPISKNLKIIINWEDMEHIKEIKDRLLSEIHGVEKVEVVEDRSLDRGGCVLETSIGTIDASINAQIQTVYEKFIELSESTRLQDEFEIIEDRTSL